jgi:hypothetical protein
MLPWFTHSTSRQIVAAILLLIAFSGVGCSRLKPSGWNFDQLRDERARDIEENLSRKEPIMANPF